MGINIYIAIFLDFQLIGMISLVILVLSFVTYQTSQEFSYFGSYYRNILFPQTYSPQINLMWIMYAHVIFYSQHRCLTVILSCTKLYSFWYLQLCRFLFRCFQLIYKQKFCYYFVLYHLFRHNVKRQIYLFFGMLCS